MVWVTEPEAVVTVLSGGPFAKGAMPPAYRCWLGDGTAASDYSPYLSEWEAVRIHKRRTFLPFLAPNFVEETPFTLWVQQSGTVNALALFHDWFFDVAWQNIFGCSRTQQVGLANQILRQTAPALSKALRETNYFDRSLPEFKRASAFGNLPG